ncbi:D-tyrosyl-tRNA(Tyr) deacylase [Candidatus Dependentiae bacterium]|nr:D-tyrosyl-tRNA(Tyr) deacylase [Candidatus Dependentiae bacterium]
MKVIIQRVSQASVAVDEKIVSKIGPGFLALVGLHHDDTIEKFGSIIKKILNLRIFSDRDDKMNTSLIDNNYELLLVSQFTLYADCTKGNRPSFMQAMPPDQAKDLYQKFIEQCRHEYVSEKVKDGVFGAMMQISLINDGPVTIVLEG